MFACPLSMGLWALSQVAAVSYNLVMSFADVADIEVKAGKGGDGRLSFRHEKFRAKGGPDGGDGGNGGNVVFAADHNLNTLAKFKTSRQVKAEDGQPGGSNRKKGKTGQDAIVYVPVGTLIREGGHIAADLTEAGQSAIIARGGKGGFGNAHFTASSRQAPRMAELGEPGEIKKLTLELKLVADVGLVGLPNAGKSTLLSVISNAKPEIADYAFTTLEPNLGMVEFGDVSFLAADIPGLIEGASKGKGLGDEFLRHIERTAVLWHLIDAGSPALVKDYRTIQTELANYAVDLSDRPQLVVLTKIETVTSNRVKLAIQQLLKAGANQVFAISAQAHKGLDDLILAAVPLILDDRDRRTVEQAKAREVVIDESTLEEPWQLVSEDGGFRLTGSRIEGFARRTDWNNPEAVERLRDIIAKTGAGKELQRLGGQPGATIKIGQHELEWRG